MSSTYSPPTDREQFPSLEEQINEDPARWLDWPLLQRGENMRARIRGIDYLRVVRAWIAVERRIDRGPREQVMDWLEEREAQLESIGDRDERTQKRELREKPERECIRIDHEGRPYRREAGKLGWRIVYLDEDGDRDD